MRYDLDRATRANVTSPRGEQPDLPTVLADGVRAAAVRLELHEEALQGIVDGHGASLGVRGLVF